LLLHWGDVGVGPRSFGVCFGGGGGGDLFRGFRGSRQHLDNLLEGGAVGLDERCRVRVSGFGSGHRLRRVRGGGRRAWRERRELRVVEAIAAAAATAAVGAVAVSRRREEADAAAVLLVPSRGFGLHR